MKKHTLFIFFLMASTAAQAADSAQQNYDNSIARCDLAYRQRMENIDGFAMKENRKAASRAEADRMRQTCSLSAKHVLERAQLYQSQHARP